MNEVFNRYIERLKKERTPLNSGIDVTEESLQSFWDDFGCLKCGYCCTKLSDVLVDKPAMKKIIKHLKISRKEFLKFTIEKDGKRYLPYPCLFYKDGCTIYEARPPACQSYPLIGYQGKIHISLH